MQIQTSLNQLSKRPLKIVILGDANSINVQRWQQGLTSAGADVHLLSIHIQQTSTAQVYPVTAPRFARLPEKLRYFTAIPSARKLIASLQPDLVIGYFVTGYGTLSAFSGFRPLIQVTSGEDILTSPANPLLRPLIKYNLSKADLIVAWAPHMASAAQALGFSAEKIFTLPRGIPLDVFRGIRAPEPQAHDPLRIISTRSLYPIYNIDVAIRAIKVLHERGITVSLTIAGDGPLRGSLEALVSDLGLEPYIRFVGVIPNDQLPRLLAQHTVALALPMIDGVSASLLEAMAVGVFPIVYDNPANRYWIQPEENGLLVNRLDPAHVADLLTQAAGDLALRHAAWTHNPPTVFERGDLQRNTVAYLERFEQVVAQYHQRHPHQ